MNRTEVKRPQNHLHSMQIPFYVILGISPWNRIINTSDSVCKVSVFFFSFNQMTDEKQMDLVCKAMRISETILSRKTQHHHFKHMPVFTFK